MSIKHRTVAQRVFAQAKLTGAAALALPFIMMLALAGCPTESDPGAPALSGTIKIQKGGADVTAAATGETLTAVYSGMETGITYQWNKGGTAIAANGTSAAYTPAEAVTGDNSLRKPLPSLSWKPAKRREPLSKTACLRRPAMKRLPL
jgi:hypothetical protein